MIATYPDVAASDIPLAARDPAAMPPAPKPAAATTAGAATTATAPTVTGKPIFHTKESVTKLVSGQLYIQEPAEELKVQAYTITKIYAKIILIGRRLFVGYLIRSFDFFFHSFIYFFFFFALFFIPNYN